MLSVSKSFVAYFLIFSIGLLVLGFCFEWYWMIYLVFVLLLGCLFLGAKEASSSEMRTLSNLDCFFRMLDSTLLIISLLGLAIRSGDRVIQLFCLIVFVLYHVVYKVAFPKAIRSEPFGRISNGSD